MIKLLKGSGHRSGILFIKHSLRANMEHKNNASNRKPDQIKDVRTRDITKDNRELNKTTDPNRKSYAR